MHIEIQVALNFVISYLYNKLPRRRVNIFGEELEKALRDKFQGHWYPEKPFKGSAYRCLKTGDPIDSVLERAARESGVPISDILENLPNELSVWVDPGEVSYRIGEKGAVKILYTENNESHEDSTSADREVTKTFNPEAQCFRPIDAVNTTMNNLSLSPKQALPQVAATVAAAVTVAVAPVAAGSPPHSASSTSPTYKGSPNPTGGASVASSNNSAAFLQRAAQAPLTFTTATFAQTKFGSTKLKTSSKRTNSSSYRMSPTEFSNYIKQRAMQQQLHHGHGVGSSAFGALGAVSPARSLSPNPLSLGMSQTAGGAAAAAAAADPFYYPNMTMGIYPQPQFNGQRGLFEAGHFNADANMGIFGGANNANGANKYSTYLEPCYFANGVAAAATGSNIPQQQLAGNPINLSNMERTNSSDSSFGMDGGDSSCSTAAEEQPLAGEATSSAIESPPDSGSPIATPTAVGVVPTLTAAAAAAAAAASASAAAASTSASASNSAGTAAAGQNSHDSSSAAVAASSAAATSANNTKLIDGLNSFYGTGSSYQQLLVAN